LKTQQINADVVGFTIPNYRPRNNQYKPSIFLEKPNVPFGLVTHFTLQKSYKTVARYFQIKETSFDEDTFERAMEFTKREFMPYLEGSRVYSDEEAQMKTDMRTSSGVPYKFMGMPVKEDFYKSPNCATFCARDWEACLRGDYPDTVIYDNIDKEEIRTQEKLDQDAIRSIMCPPADHLHTGQRLFADQNARLTASHLLTASAIGLSKTNGWWSQMVRKLGKFAYGFAGDESGWDASLIARLMNVARDIRIAATPEQAVRIKNYYKALIYTNVRMPDGTIIRKKQGNPSGSVNTSYDNTIILFFLMAYCWIENCNNSYRDFRENVEMVLYGDDNTFTVARDYIRVYNLYTLGITMRKFGVTLKNPDDPPKHYSELDFLSHKWKKEHGFWLPYMNSDKLKMGIYYSEYPTDPFMQSLIIIEYIITNPFDVGFYEYCLGQLEILYPYMALYDVHWLKRHIPTKDECFKLYTGAEGNLVFKLDPVVFTPQCKARVRNFNNVPHFKVETLRRLTDTRKIAPQMSNTTDPIQLVNPPHDEADIARGRQILKSQLLTGQAARWFTRAVDPFHDTTVEPAGYPDLMTVGTVVQEINLSANVSAPTSVAGNWDCHVFNMAHIAAAINGVNNKAITWRPATGVITAFGFSPDYSNGGITIIKGPTGGILMPNALASAIDPLTQAQTLSPINFMMGRCRVVGMAFEVINTTAEIYLQGLTTAYRMPQVKQTGMMSGNSISSGAVTSWELRPLNVFVSPPVTATEAITLPSSKQWPASRGAYCVCTQMGIENPITSVDNVPTFYSTGGFLSDQTATSFKGFGSAVSTLNQNDPVLQSQYYAPFNTSGVWLTGLSNQTTLQVNVKIIMESIPDPRGVFATMAKPATPYSVEALRLYGELIEKLPVGCPFDENPDGEWFSTVLGTLGELAKMGSMINPMFGLIGHGFGLGKKVYDRISHAMDTKINEKTKKISDKVDKKIKEKNKHNVLEIVRRTPPVHKRVQEVKFGNVPSKVKFKRVQGETYADKVRK